MRELLIIAAILLSSATARAGDDAPDPRELIVWAKVSDLCSSCVPARTQGCSAYLKGVADAINAMSYLTVKQRQLCPPDHITETKLEDVVIPRLGDYTGNSPAAAAVYLILNMAYHCPDMTGSPPPSPQPPKRGDHPA